MSSQRLRSRGLGVWAGLFVAPAAWYAAHQASFYVLSVNCAGPRWLVALIHVLALLFAGGSGVVSARAEPGASEQAFPRMLAIGAAAVFSVAILWPFMKTPNEPVSTV